MITTYECEHCHNSGDNGWRDPDACLRHESKCDYNPKNKTCATCKHYDYASTTEQRMKWREPDFGCLIFGDQTWRTQCEKWQHNKPAANPPNADFRDGGTATPRT